jgi:hypothetical protein
VRPPVFLELLGDLAESGHPTPCQVDPEPFTSGSTERRGQAAAACLAGCPLLEECAAYGEQLDARHHVWGGADLTTEKGSR